MASENDREAWIKLPTEHESLDSFPADHPYSIGAGRVPAMARLISAHPEFAPHFQRLVARIMFGPGALERTEREMIAAVAAAAQDCHY
jgi:alkylhydroperoxidase family enzyme